MNLHESNIKFRSVNEENANIKRFNITYKYKSREFIKTLNKLNYLCYLYIITLRRYFI